MARKTVRKWSQENMERAANATKYSERAALARELNSSVRSVAFYGNLWKRQRGDEPVSKRWTPEEDELLLKVTDHRSLSDAALKIGVPVEKARRHMYEVRRRNGKSRYQHQWSREENEKLWSFENVQDALKWAKSEGLSESTARQHYYSHGGRQYRESHPRN